MVGEDLQKSVPLFMFYVVTNIYIYEQCNHESTLHYAKNNNNINQNKIYVSRRRKKSDIWMFTPCFEPNPNEYVASTSKTYSIIANIHQYAVD